MTRSEPERLGGGRFAGRDPACYRGGMPRGLHFVLGFITFVTLAVGAVRALVRHMPDALAARLGRGSYEALVLALAAGFVVIVLRAAREHRTARAGHRDAAPARPPSADGPADDRVADAAAVPATRPRRGDSRR